MHYMNISREKIMLEDRPLEASQIYGRNFNLFWIFVRMDEKKATVDAVTGKVIPTVFWDDRNLINSFRQAKPPLKHTRLTY